MRSQGVIILCWVLFVLPCVAAAAAAAVATESECPDGETVEELGRKVEQLSRQVMLQQLFVEEKIRNDGASGIKQCRINQQGTLPFHATTVVKNRVASIHEHPNGIRTVGMGELAAVLNGLEFRTRHNDYRLAMPEQIMEGEERITYGAIRDVTYPQVPPEVLAAGSVHDQIIEMREWFRAFRDQDHSVRDYRKYFKAALCYLEGAWTLPTDKLDESFASDRHFIDADSWHDLQEKVRFTSYTGRKDAAENLAYLPTTIVDVEGGNLTMAQWNYRILCHPLNRHLSTKRLTVIDDIASRIANGHTMVQHEKSRAARYRVAPVDSDKWTERTIRYDLLDELMGEIPGYDGYDNELVDPGLDDNIAMQMGTDEKLKAGYYHRWVKAAKDAMGTQIQHRGYADENLFMARTTQPKIAAMKMEHCKGKRKNRVCSTSTQRWTYAIPLEIIYLNPLHRWNPYNITYKGSHRTEEGKTVFAGGRNGRTAEMAINGTHSRAYYQTPAQFFTSSTKGSKDAADTASDALWVLGEDGAPHQMFASGIRVHLPEIEGVGRLRQRYPIMPFSYEGSAAWKELTALKHIILEKDRYKHMFYDSHENNADLIFEQPAETDVNKTNQEPATITLILKTSQASSVEPHEHFIEVPLSDLQQLAKNPKGHLKVTTDESNGHNHELTIKVSKKGWNFWYDTCDSRRGSCIDRHPRHLKVEY